MNEKQFLEDLKRLVEIPSVRDISTAQQQAPFGKHIREAFNVFKEIAEREGMQVEDVDGYAISAQIGEGEDYVGVLGHLDVVEAGDLSLWDSNPFQLKIQDGILYGRGVNDDKGPLLAALYAISRIQKENRKLRYPIRLIAGGAEETTWECMHTYFKNHKQPVCGFSPDGNFPIVNGEKGILQIRYVFPQKDGMNFISKERLNYVCDDLEINMKNISDDLCWTNANEVNKDGKNVQIRYKGKRSLSRNPQRGENAIFKFVKDWINQEQKENTPSFITMIEEQFLDDFYGKKSGLYYDDEQMGQGSVCLMSLQSIPEGIELCIDVRYVKSVTEEVLLSRLKTIGDMYGAKLEIINHKRLLYVDEKSHLIQSLQKAYETVMHEKAEIFTKGGASYARVLDHGVAFGATFPDEDPRPHMPNECMPLSSLMKAYEIYYTSLLELACE